MHEERTLLLDVVNWPRFCQRTRIMLDADIVRDEEALRSYVQGRFGEGTLRKIGEECWEYERQLPGPSFIWRILSVVLNKSYA